MSKSDEKRIKKNQKTLFETFKKQRTQVPKHRENSWDDDGENGLPASDTVVEPVPVDQPRTVTTASIASNSSPTSPPTFETRAPAPALVTVSSQVPSAPAPTAESSTNQLKLPKDSTMKKWKVNYDWLMFTERNTMICKICVSQKEKLLLKNPSLNMGFLTGSTNYKLSALNDHNVSECHLTGISEMKHEEALADGKSLQPKHVIHKVPVDSAIASGMQKMNDKERAGIVKLMDISYFIALKAVHGFCRPY